MKFDFITAFPEIIEFYTSQSLIQKAKDKGIVEINVFNPRDTATDKHRSIDDRPFGGGEGMVMMAQPLALCFENYLKVRQPQKPHIIHLSPQGETFHHSKIAGLLQHQNICFLCSRYSGIDQRFLNEYVDQELSLGDYVVAGGELPALVIMESLARFIPGFLGDKDSAQLDSFSIGGLEAPLFSQPRSWRDQDVPEVLTSGNHKKIDEWKKNASVLMTCLKRPDLLSHFTTKDIQQAMVFLKQVEPGDLKSLGLYGKSENLMVVMEAALKKN